MAKKGNIPWNKGLKTGKQAYNSLNLNKDELYDLYITKELTSEEIAEIYNCSSKAIRNWLKRFNIPIRSTGDSIKLERSKWSDEKELERSKKFHKTWSERTPEQNKERYDKMMAHGTINSPEAILKAHITRSINGTSNTSKSEENFYYKLQLIGIDKDDIIHPYYSDNRYPYSCDFYIKSKDLFIEYQGHQTHGDEPWTGSEDQIKKLINLQDKGYDMSTWFKRDPDKLKTAIKNNIKLVLVYPKNKTYFLKNNNLVTIDINDINKI